MTYNVFSWTLNPTHFTSLHLSGLSSQDNKSVQKDQARQHLYSKHTNSSNSLSDEVPQHPS